MIPFLLSSSMRTSETVTLGIVDVSMIVTVFKDDGSGDSVGVSSNCT